MTADTHTLAEPRLRTALTRMFEAAARDDEAAARVRSLRPDGRAALTAQELADANREVYMPISADGGRLLCNLVRATRPNNVVEFGTSYGISTLHLAAAGQPVSRSGLPARAASRLRGSGTSRRSIRSRTPATPVISAATVPSSLTMCCSIVNVLPVP